MSYTHPIIEQLLRNFAPAIGKDMDKYKNHVYRVFQHSRLLDSEPANEEKYAIAAVFHDIGIWTHQTIDYLDPSIRELQRFLAETGKEYWIAEISAMIYWHHKISPYRGAYNKTVEVFRRADWTDVTFGLLTFGSDRAQIGYFRRVRPYLGFHWFLVKKVSANFLRHPLNPLPMFTR